MVIRIVRIVEVQGNVIHVMEPDCKIKALASGKYLVAYAKIMMGNASGVGARGSVMGLFEKDVSVLNIIILV